MFFGWYWTSNEGPSEDKYFISYNDVNTKTIFSPYLYVNRTCLKHSISNYFVFYLILKYTEFIDWMFWFWRAREPFIYNTFKIIKTYYSHWYFKLSNKLFIFFPLNSGLYMLRNLSAFLVLNKFLPFMSPNFYLSKLLTLLSCALSFMNL